MNAVADGRVAGGGAQAEGDDVLGLASLLDELAHGVLITTVEGRVVHANQAAQFELARHRVLTKRHSVLQGCTPESARNLREALAKVTQGKRSLIVLPAKEGPGLALVVLPLRAQAAGRAPKAALLFARASVSDSLMLGFFARCHGLTATEEHVLGILCEGFSAPQVADQMKVAVSTVRSHVRSLCSKTRSSGVRELVSRVAVLPPVAPPFWSEPMH
jgi:DNA-binding CsgD family transcriptional regulator